MSTSPRCCLLYGLRTFIYLLMAVKVISGLLTRRAAGYAAEPLVYVQRP
jgi:hypothetical protein